MNIDNLQVLFENYMANFDLINSPKHNENYKWEAIEQVQREWDIDAENISEMIKRAFCKSFNLINNRIVQPVSGIVALAKVEPETIRAAFKELLKEDCGDIDARQGRILSFLDTCNALLEKHYPGKWKYVQDMRSVIDYLAMIKPAENYLFKAMTAHYFAKYMEYGNDIGAGQTFKLRNYYEMCDQLVQQIANHSGLLKIDDGRTPKWKDPSHHVLAYDLIYCLGVYGFTNGMKMPVSKKKHSPAKQSACREEMTQALQQEIDVLQDQIDALVTSLSGMLKWDFTGQTLKTKAFGVVDIHRQEGRYVYFTVQGAEKKFSIPDSIAGGFLIPEDTEIIKSCKQEMDLLKQIDALEKKQKIKYMEIRHYQ
ncbi:MAG: hypothetical protein IKJ11_05760 [Clostridia bacterium]|nr:hypothetical protein [Clostridia bacterium]